MPKLKNYTSEVSPARSVSLIEELLVQAGAHGVSKTYEDKLPVSISFLMDVKGQTLAFRMEAKIEAVETILFKEISRPRADTKQRIKEQALRTAWKNIHDLIAAQVAMLITEQAEALELFLPAFLPNGPNGKTVYERISSGNMKLLN